MSWNIAGGQSSFEYFSVINHSIILMRALEALDPIKGAQVAVTQPKPASFQNP